MNYLFIMLLLCVSSSAHAVEWMTHGSLKNETAYFISGQQRFDKIQNRIDLKPEALLSDRWEFRGRFLAWYDAAMDVEATNKTSLTKGIKDYYRFYAQSKEAYFLYGGDDFDFSIGQQQVVWGKTDGLRMLDVINPLDMREFILDDFLDSRIGLWSAKLNGYTDIAGLESEFEFIVVPDARPVKLAPSGSRWAYRFPPPPAGINVAIAAANKPMWRPSDIEAGMAWRSNIAGWDISLNWYYGWKDTPNLLKKLVPGLLTITPAYHRMHTVGGSFSNAFGAMVLRTEIAANIGETVDAIGFTHATSTQKMTTFNASVGIDYNKYNWRISPQFFIRHLSKWKPNIAEDQASGFVSLMVSTDYLNEKLKPDAILLYDWADGSWMFRPKVAYEWNDNIALRAGLDMLGGNNGFFGQFANNDRVFTEFEYTF